MDILSIFSERLKELMEERGINAPALGKAIKTDRTNLTRYLRGERLPQYSTFVAIAEYFGCSADFLVGRVDFPPAVRYLPPKPFSETFRALLSETHTSQYRLEHALSLSGAVVYSWLHGDALPSVENLVRLARFWDCSLDRLLGRE